MNGVEPACRESRGLGFWLPCRILALPESDLGLQGSPGQGLGFLKPVPMCNRLHIDERQDAIEFRVINSGEFIKRVVELLHKRLVNGDQGVDAAPAKT